MAILNGKALRDWLKSRAVNNLLTTEKGFWLDARIGPAIQKDIDDLKTLYDEINSNLIKIGTKNDTGVNISLLQSKNGKVLFAVCNTPGYYVGRLFLNVYSIWYAAIYDVQTKAQVTNGVAVSVIYGYIK